MADDSIKLILELENKAKKDFDNVNKEIKELKKQAKAASKEIDGIDDGFNKNSKSSKKLNTNLKKTNTEIGKTSKGFSGAAKAAGGLTVAATAVGAAFLTVINNSRELNKELNQLSTLSGLGFENFQILSEQAQGLGISADQFSDAVNNIFLKIDEAAKLGTGAGIEIFKNMNLDVQELSRLDPIGKLQAIQKEAKNLSKEELRLNFDELASDNGILLASNLQNINLNVEEIKKQGNINILTEEESKKIQELDAKILEIKNNFSKLGLELTEQVSPILIETLEDLTELIDTISNSYAFEAATRFVNVLRNVITSVSGFAVSLGSVLTDFVFFIGNKIPAGFKELILTINSLSSNLGIEVFSDDFIKKTEEDLAILENSSKKRFDNIKNTVKDTYEDLEEDSAFRSIQINIGITREERQLLQDALNGDLKTIEQINRALAITKAEFSGIAKTELIDSIEANKVKIQVELDKDSVKKTGEDTNKEIKKIKPNIKNFIDVGFLDTIKNAQLEIYKLENAFVEAFDFENKETINKIKKAKEALQKYNEELKKSKGIPEKDVYISVYDQQINDLEKLIELERQRAQVQQIDFNKSQLTQKLELGLLNETEFNESIKSLEESLIKVFGEGSIEVAKFRDEILQTKEAVEGQKLSDLREDQTETEQQFDLGLINEEEFIAKMEVIQEQLRLTFGEDSVEFESFRQGLEDVKAELDTFGQISLATFSKFSEGFGKAVTDSLLYGKSLKDGLGNLLQSIIQQLIQAAIQALIFSAILSSTGLGGAQTANMGFGDIFKQQFAGNLGVPTRHNGGAVGREGDARNSTKMINLADPSRSLLPQERLIVAKTDESVIKTNELNSPTGVGSNQPLQPEVKISNYITDDVMTGFLKSDAAVDEIINIINNNSDRTR